MAIADAPVWYPPGPAPRRKRRRRARGPAVRSTSRRRFATGVLLIVLSGSGFWLFVHGQGWGLVYAVPILLVGVYAVILASQTRHRRESGRQRRIR